MIQPCKQCYKEYNAQRAEILRAQYLKRTYNLTELEYANMLSKQKGLCAICNTTMKVVNIDHCHTTNKVRGLLCPECNRGLGLFYDDADRLLSAAEYLKNGN